MRRLLLALSVVLLLPALSLAVDTKAAGDKPNDAGKKATGQNVSGGETEVKEEVVKTKYIIHFRNGGELETDNYIIEKDTIKIELSSGAIYLDKKMVRRIEEVQGEEDETVKSVVIKPAAPKVAPKEKPEETTRRRTDPGVPPSVEMPKEVVDSEGHNEAWWMAKVDEWKKKKEDAEQKYGKAESDWNRYNGLLSATGGLSEYDQLRYQDLRGSARVDMDEALAEKDAADRMLNEVLPEEARKAGAPPGWVR